MMREAVVTLLLVRQRLDVHAAAQPSARSRVLRSMSAMLARPYLPEEIWLSVCMFLRGADFMHKLGQNSRCTGCNAMDFMCTCTSTPKTSAFYA